eukprot:ANDGO_02013.mRNA.1 hypothetical protein
MSESLTSRLNHLWSLGFATALETPGLSRYYMTQFRHLATLHGVSIKDQTWSQACFACGTVYLHGSNCSVKHLPAIRKSHLHHHLTLRMRIKCSVCGFKKVHSVRLDLPKPANAGSAMDAKIPKQRNHAATITKPRPSPSSGPSLFILDKNKPRAQLLANDAEQPQQPQPLQPQPLQPQKKTGEHDKTCKKDKKSTSSGNAGGKLGNYLASLGIKM